MKRNFTIPPGVWWRQSAAAKLEAARLSPLPIEDARIVLRRIGLWRPDQAGTFEVEYERKDATNGAGGGQTWNLPLTAGAALALLLAIGGTFLKQSSVQATPPPGRPGVPAPLIENHQPVSQLVTDLAEIVQRKPTNVRIEKISWTPDSIALETADVSALQQALAQQGTKKAITVTAGEQK